MEFIQKFGIDPANDKILVIWNNSFNFESCDFSSEEMKSQLGANISFENIHRLDFAQTDATYTFIILKSNENVDLKFLASILKILRPKGRLLTSMHASQQLKENLKMAGFVNIVTESNDIIAEKPSYEVGSAAKLSFANKKLTSNTAASVWKIADDVDFINEDDLLDETDKIKPDPNNLKVCGTTGKRKACKDCSCGLAEELIKETHQMAQPTESAKSSCGSCYLGDAFRCATCPYLGMPAFKPGEKVQLAGALLKDDLENSKTQFNQMKYMVLEIHFILIK